MNDDELFGSGRVRLLFPKVRASEFLEVDGPLIFLAGPVRGGKDWQSEAARMIAERAHAAGKPVQIAIPYYHKAENPFELWKYRTGEDSAQSFPRQRDWEEDHIILAQHYGCLVFWLSEEDPNDMRQPGEGPYAQDTRGELGRYSARREFLSGLRMVTGGPPEFHGFDLIRRNEFADLVRGGRAGGMTEDDYVLPSTLPDTIDAALSLAFRPVEDW